MSRIKFIYCKPCILSPLEDFRASNKGQRQTYKSVSRFLCALHKGHRQIPQTRDTALLPCRCACSGQSCPILFDSTGCSPPSSSVHGILQARIPEWVAMPSSKGSSQSRDQTQLSCIAGRFFYHWAPPSMREAEVSQPSHLCIHGTAYLRAGMWRKAVFPSSVYWRPRLGTVLRWPQINFRSSSQF